MTTVSQGRRAGRDGDRLVRWARDPRGVREGGLSGAESLVRGEQQWESTGGSGRPLVPAALREAGPGWGRQQWSWWRATRECQKVRERESGDACRWARLGAGACMCARVHRRTWDCEGADASGRDAVGGAVSPWWATRAGDPHAALAKLEEALLELGVARARGSSG